MYIVQRQGTSWVLESYIYSTDAVRFLYINYSLLIFEKHYISRLSQQTISYPASDFRHMNTKAITMLICYTNLPITS